MIASSAPLLLAGLLLAGAIHVSLPADWIQGKLRGNSLSSVLKASLFGMPLPLCSCSVIPIGSTLRSKGASRGATASFFISTPEIGIDSFLLSYTLLGLPLAIIRVIAAFISAISAGIMVNYIYRHEPDVPPSEPPPEATTPCCSSRSCSAEHTENKSSFLSSALTYALKDLPDDIGKLLLIGFVLGGLCKALMPDNFLDILSNYHPITTSLAVIPLAVPLYLCAASSTPFIASLLEKGLPVGAGLMMLLAGPATNMSTILVVRRECGLLGLVAYLVAIIGVALLCTIILPYVPLYLSSTITVEHHTHGFGIFSHLSGAVLLALLLRPFFPSTSWSKQPTT